MNRALKWFFRILVLCLWASGVHAAEPAAKNPQAQSSQTAQQLQEAPSIQIPETVFNFGEVMEGSEVIHEFTVKNTGKGDLQINQVRPG
jgi:hypothetical protein